MHKCRKDGLSHRCRFCSSLHTKHHSMLSRCYNEKDERYHNYGGRGITVCSLWRTNKKAFFTWCIANGLAAYLHVDRIDNEGNYEPGNCRITTVEINSQNRRDTKLSVEKVKEIKHLLKEGELNQHQIAARYGVKNEAISKIHRGTRWKNVTI